MTAPATEAVLSLQELREAAETLERQAVAAKVVTEADLDERRPGGEKYPDVGPHAWLAYHGWLMGRVLTQGAGPDVRTRTVAGVLTASLLEAPEPVALQSGALVSVHPKSLHTLLLLEGLDAEVRQARADLLELLAVAEDEEDRTTIARAELLEAMLRSKCIRVWAWIVTHPGVGLPFSDERLDLEPPAWTTDLTVSDLAALVLAHAQVNRDDVGFIAQAFPSDDAKRPSRLPLSGFLGAMAQEWGLRAQVLMQEWSLRGLFAQALAAAQSAREARLAADPARR